MTREPNSTADLKLDIGRVVQRAMDLTNVESPTGKEAEVAQLYKKMMEEVGMRVTLQEVEPGRFNAIGVLKGSGGGASLMFNGHMDTSFSPRDPPELLRAISPVYKFEPPWAYREGDWVYGQGVFNMKAALASYVGAVEAIQNSGMRLKGDIVIAGVVGEIEKSQVDQYVGPQYRGYGFGTSYLVTHGGVADCAILGEPTGMRLMLAHFGSVWAKISLKGKIVHTGQATTRETSGTSNLILQMKRIIDRIEAWIPDYQARYQYQSVAPPVNFGAVEGGWPWRASRTPWFCNLFLDVRFPPRRSPTEVKAEASRACSRALRRYLGIRADLELYVTDGWAEIDEGEYLVGALEAAHAKALGKAPDRIVETWSSDANVLIRNGIPAVNYGPTGAPGKQTRGTMHTTDLDACTRVYALTANDVCNQERRKVRLKPFSITYI